MANWAEIRDLASQLKTTQDKQAAQYLSERTWVDIVKHLISANRLKLIYTTDGRSYLTKDELEKEIREEVEAHNGRVQLTEVASNLDIDFLLVEAKAAELVSADAQTKQAGRLMSIPGELINETYIRQVAHEIQDRFEERGHLTLGELTTIFGLPTAFLTNVINQYQGVLFRISKYGEKYITDTYMTENKAKVMGYFAAIMRPVVLNSASAKLSIPENLLSSILNGLINSGQLSGSLLAGRGIFVPTCYSQAESAYVSAFYTQNGYVEWAYLKRLGIVDPGGYLRSLLPTATHLSGVSIGPAVIHQLKALVEEATRDGTWVDLSHCLPVGLTSKERTALLSPHVKQLPVKIIDDGLFIVSDVFIDKCEAYFDNLISEKAAVAAREERQPVGTPSHVRNVSYQDSPGKRGCNTPKGGFGVGAREIKTKNVKKKYAPGKRRADANASIDNDYDLSGMDPSGAMNADVVFSKYVAVEELVELLVSLLPADVPNEVSEGVVELLLTRLERAFSNRLASIFIPNSDTARRRESVAHTQSAVNDMLFAIQLMERGIMSIDQISLQTQLLRHLVKTHGACLVDRLCVHLARYYDLQWPSTPNKLDSAETSSTSQQNTPDFITPLSSEQRVKLVNLLRQSDSADAIASGTALQELIEKMRLFIQSSNTAFIDYYSAVEKLATEHMGLSLTTTLHTKHDVKRKREERTKANELAVQLESQMEHAMDSVQASPTMQAVATATLAITCLLTQAATGWPVTAPGKCVPELVAWLSEFVKSKKQSLDSSTAPSAAVQMLTSSPVIEQLVSLTGHISHHMHSTDETEWNAELSTLIGQIADSTKRCRRVLYS